MTLKQPFKAPVRFKVRLRRATLADATKIRNIHVASILGLTGKEYSASDSAAWAAGKKPEQYREAMRSGETQFVALAGTKALGFSAVKAGEICAVYVHPNAARRGIGSRLLKA